jgi:hypothetical protein
MHSASAMFFSVSPEEVHLISDNFI